MTTNIRKKIGKKLYKFFFGKELKHLNETFNKWRLNLLEIGIQKDKSLKKIIDEIPEKYIKNHWVKDEMGSEYKKLVTKIRVAKTLEFIKKDINSKFNLSILDVGASNGLFLSQFNGNHIGVNIEQVCVEQINENGFKGVKGNITKLPFEDNSFEVVFCFEVLEHLDNPIKAIRELARISKKYLYLSTPFIRDTKLFSYNSEKEKAETNQHVFMFDLPDIRNLITYSDLRISDISLVDPIKLCRVVFINRVKVFLLNHKFPKWTLIKLEKNI